MKNNYSWLDNTLDTIVVVNGLGYDAYAITETVDLAKQTIISQIEIEKLRARIDTLKELIDNHRYGKSRGLDYIYSDDVRDMLADLTEKLKKGDK